MSPDPRTEIGGKAHRSKKALLDRLLGGRLTGKTENK
jgi:hypothetical protein